ncbi:MAG: hypothetical protein M5U19_22890 [Microthrixaceae bacterium]|nr:hypothetical protein [Microthrixaceae bacterium]
MAALIEGGLDPAAVADQVVDAVRERRPWVLTHPDWMDMVRSRTERIIAEEPPPPTCPRLRLTPKRTDPQRTDPQRTGPQDGGPPHWWLSPFSSLGER